MSKQHEEDRKTDQPVEADSLMAVYNPQPPAPEQTVRFYWQEPWRDAAGLAADDAVQAAFEN